MRKAYHMTTTTQPLRSRPDIPVDYGVPATEEGMLDWSWAEAQLIKARHYWLVTSYPDGRLHTVPSWGAWIDQALYFGGGEMTRHARNLQTNPGIVAHLESGDEVVIIYGLAQKAADVPQELMIRIEAQYAAKYGMAEGANYRLIPHKVLAWTSFPTRPTRFLFKPDRLQP